MANYALFPAKVVTPEGIIFDGEVRELELTSVSGGLGVLARRAPIVADLKMGHMRAMLEDGSWKVWATQTGFAQASDSTATVVVEDAVAVDQIDDEQNTKFIEDKQAQKSAAEQDGDEHAVLTAERAIAWGKHLTAIKKLHG